MLLNSETTLTNSQISEFILEREYTNYFHLQQSLSELVESGLIEMRTISNTSHYCITEEGKSAFSFFDKEISQDIKTEVKDYLKVLGCKVEERILTPADYYTTDQGSYIVRCQIIEKNISLLDINISAPSLEAAKSMCRSWPEKSEDIYGKIMEELI